MCICLLIYSTSISVIDSYYERLKEDVLSFREKEKVILLGGPYHTVVIWSTHCTVRVCVCTCMCGDFNARVGRSAQLDDVIGIFGENMCNASGN